MNITTLPEVEGAIIKSINGKEPQSHDLLTIEFEDGRQVAFMHYQDCCESVVLEDGHAESLEHLIGGTIYKIEERVECPSEEQDVWGSCTWTFYEIVTAKGSETIRFIGEASGYYSERVDIEVRNSGGAM